MTHDVKNLQAICKPLRLLYVEDDVNARNVTIRMLGHFFDHIISKNDGKEGLEAFKEGNFDLIISDVNMPHMNGLEMLREIREISPEVPFLFLSAYSESEYFMESISLGVDYFILKPIKQEQFYEALSVIVRKIEYKKIKDDYQESLETELSKRTEELVNKLYNDELTGLGSRYAFFEKLTTMDQGSLFLIDIEKFRVINDIYGHKIGNKVLKGFGLSILAFCNQEKLNAYRLSGDEFAILKDSDTIDADYYEELVKNLLKQLKSEHLSIDSYRISVSMHIGIAFGKEKLYEEASIALHYAKENQKEYIVYSSKFDNTKDQKRLLDERKLIQDSIDLGNIVPVFQPIVGADGKVRKYETLMRLRDQKNLGLISPASFLQTAILTGLYDYLSQYLILKGLHFIEKEGKCNLSFNFSYSDITNSEFIYELERFFKEYPDVGKRVIFEITESESIYSYELVRKFIQRFRKYGVRIAIDDFGSGFSNFSYIIEIEPDYLKIDGSLIKDIQSDEKLRSITKTIVEFSHNLNIKVIAEYVHSKEVFEILKSLGVDEFQGYYFSKPLEDIQKW